MKKITYKLSEDTFDYKEINTVIKLFKSKQKLSYGKKVKLLEKKIAKIHKRKYAIMVNSGSSANLLGVSAVLFDHKFNLKKGDEIIVPALSWSTTYSPLIQLGFKLVFVDIDLKDLNISIEQLKKSITKKTRAIFAVNILGATCNFNEIKKICRKKNILLFEDNCESLGAKYKKKLAGSFGLFSSLSSFYSHHICTIEGGFLLTDSFRLYCNALSLRSHGWLREQPSNSHLKSKFDYFLRFFKFSLPGYNIRPTEVNAVIGIEQIKKLNQFIKFRKNNAKTFGEIFKNNKNIHILKYDNNNSYFGLIMMLKNKLLNKRKKVINLFDKLGIEARPIVSGNITNCPMIEWSKFKIIRPLTNAKYIEQNGLMIGNRSRKLNYKEIKILNLLNHKLSSI
jgi:CDP-6-deoxy-D-xylo-4-hexulose-3-dehydrase